MSPVEIVVDDQVLDIQLEAVELDLELVSDREEIVTLLEIV